MAAPPTRGQRADLTAATNKEAEQPSEPAGLEPPRPRAKVLGHPGLRQRGTPAGPPASTLEPANQFGLGMISSTSELKTQPDHMPTPFLKAVRLLHGKEQPVAVGLPASRGTPFPTFLRGNPTRHDGRDSSRFTIKARAIPLNTWLLLLTPTGLNHRT